MHASRGKYGITVAYYYPGQGDTLYSDLSDTSAVSPLMQEMCHPVEP